MSRDDEEVPFEERPTPPIEDTDRPKARRGTGQIAAVDFGIDGQVTDPITWLEEELDADTRDLVHRSARPEGDGTPWAQFVKLVHRGDQRERRWRRAFRWFRDELVKIRKVISPEWLAEVNGATSTVKAARRIVYAAAGLLAASLVTLWASYRDHEQTVGADKVRAERVQTDLGKLGDRLDKFEERFNETVKDIYIALGRRGSLEPHHQLAPDTSTRAADTAALAQKGNPP